jgi:hypothetical protein
MMSLSTLTTDDYTLMQQAMITTNRTMQRAVHNIDETFGDGYAQQHPELIGAYMKTAAIDLGTAFIARAIEDTAGEIAGVAKALEGIAGEIGRAAGKWPPP